MKKMTYKDVQRISVEILMYIDKICRENDIQYSIYYGSLIGVERHQGYIPWDDDLDIVLTRPNYERLLDLLKNSTEYKLLSFETRDNYRYCYAKLIDPNTAVTTKQYNHSEDPDMGVFVDIFPFDGFPTDENERHEYAQKCEEYRANMMFTLNHSYAISRSKIKAIGKRVLLYPKFLKMKKIGDYHFWKEKYEELATSYPYEKAKYCGYTEFADEVWGVFPVEWFEHYEDVEFEGHKVMAIKNRKDFLTLRYGNYMELPPKEEQVTHHPYDFYFRGE
ncbi:MAG: phosphorylcholine transferase LicD [Enterococcus sp.]